MTFTKGQKRLAAVLGVALLAYAADQFVFTGTPQSADARAALPVSSDGSVAAANGESAAGREPGSQLVAVRQATTRPTPTGGSFGATAVQQRLVLASKTVDTHIDQSRDIFFPNWKPRALAEAPAGPAAGTPAPPRFDPAAEFAARHRLRALLVRYGEGVALVNDRLLKVGQSLGGFRLSAIGRHSVMFERAGVMVELKLSDETSATDPSSRAVESR